MSDELHIDWQTAPPWGPTIICPHCGYADKPTTTDDVATEQRACPRCGRVYLLSVEVEYRYHTSPRTK